MLCVEKGVLFGEENHGTDQQDRVHIQIHGTRQCGGGGEQSTYSWWSAEF
jgi:hypothetical protein